jgi:hypothetical protein
MHAVELASFGTLYIPSFKEIMAGVQAILRFGLRNLRGLTLALLKGETCDVHR